MLRFPAAPAVFLDFDGCLVDLAPTPMAVRVPRGLPGLLMRLHRATGGATALVSGRPIADLRRFLPSVSLRMVGSHGAERTRGRGAVDVIPINREGLARLTVGAADILGDVPGLLLERKPVAVGLHYRGNPSEGPRVHKEAQALVDTVAGFHLHVSKGLVELRPDGIGKGGAVRWLMSQPPFRGRAPVMFGDDATDEPAFQVANGFGGLSVKVGAGATAAARRVGSPGEVRRALSVLADGLDGR